MKKNNKIEKATIVLKKTKYIMLTLAVVRGCGKSCVSNI